MSDPDRIRLRHMLDAATEALRFIAGRGKEDLAVDRQLALALIKEIEIIGEAASRISIEVKEGRPDIPWLSDCRHAESLDPYIRGDRARGSMVRGHLGFAIACEDRRAASGEIVCLDVPACQACWMRVAMLAPALLVAEGSILGIYRQHNSSA